MKKIITLLTVTLLCLGHQTADATSSSPGCDPCPGAVWNAPVTTTFTFSLPSKPGCTYKGYVKYRTRNCNGMTQIDVLPRPVFEDLSGGNPNCVLHCINGGELHKIVYNHILNLLGTGATVINVEESPCYYVGEITVPPGAEVCYGMTPGTRKWIYMPCDINGCCYSELTPVGSTTYYKNVIQSTTCPTTPYTPPSAEIEWECDILGGGTAKFIVPFTPDMPIICQHTCMSGYAKPAKPSNVLEMTEEAFANLHIFPNPVNDELHISFSAQAGDDITVQLIDVTGRLVTEKQLHSIGGNQEVVIDTKLLTPGTYSVKVIYPGGQLMTKVVK